jgi:hypothetical protein
MTARERAIKLCKIYSTLVSSIDKYTYLTREEENNYIRKGALLCLDEIRDAMGREFIWKVQTDYWNEVELEIEKWELEI